GKSQLTTWHITTFQHIDSGATVPAIYLDLHKFPNLWAVDMVQMSRIACKDGPGCQMHARVMARLVGRGVVGIVRGPRGARKLHRPKAPKIRRNRRQIALIAPAVVALKRHRTAQAEQRLLTGPV